MYGEKRDGRATQREEEGERKKKSELASKKRELAASIFPRLPRLLPQKSLSRDLYAPACGNGASRGCDHSRGARPTRRPSLHVLPSYSFTQPPAFLLSLRLSLRLLQRRQSKSIPRPRRGQQHVDFDLTRERQERLVEGRREARASRMREKTELSPHSRVFGF